MLEEKFKKSIQNDYRSFFKSEDTYKRLQVPWKRGLIFMGVSYAFRCITMSDDERNDLWMVCYGTDG